MNRYPRLPAIIVLVAFGLLGLGLRLFNRTGAASSVETVKAQIQEYTKNNKQAPPELWRKFGDTYYEARDYHSAADAYQQALLLQPGNREAKFAYGLALAQADRPELLPFLTDLSINDAPQAVRLFERPELQKYLHNDAFEKLAREARNNAVD